MSNAAVMEKQARGKGQLTDDQRGRLVVVQRVKVRTEGAEDGVQVEGQGQDANGEDGLDVAVEDESGSDDDGEEGFPNHDEGLPEHQLLLVCPVEESSGVGEPDVAGGRPARQEEG